MRISVNNLKTYLQEQLGDEYVKQESYKINDFPSLVQHDYGEEKDCSLVSITAAIAHVLPQSSVPAIYYTTIQQTSPAFYNGKTFGTIPFMIKSIYDKTLAACGIIKKSKVKYLRGLGYCYQDIQSAIITNTSVIISAQNMNDGFYKNHSVIAFGFVTYANADKEVKLLIVQDNWYHTISYIDYNKISKISCINY